MTYTVSSGTLNSTIPYHTKQIHFQLAGRRAENAQSLVPDWFENVANFTVILSQLST